MPANQILLEAIAHKKCVVATYNRVQMKLTPYILYKRNDSLYIDAVAVEKAGQPPREIKLGAYNLAGLNEVTLTDQHFETVSLFDPTAPKYEGATLFAIKD